MGMTKNQDGTYIYLIVPEKFNCVYKNLLTKISELGIDIINDCTSTCRGANKHVINCWNMFQAACAAYTLGEEKKANLLINYINGQLKMTCPKLDDGESESEPEPTPEPEPVKEAKLTGFSITGVSNGTGRLIKNVESINLTIENPDLIKAGTLKVYDNSANTVIATCTSISNNPSTGKFTISIAEGVTKSYIVKAETDNGIIQSNIVTITRSKAVAVTNRYYGTNENITESTITSGTKFTNKAIAKVNVPTKVFWIAIPATEKLVIDNADMAGDYYYNPDAGYDNNRLTKSTVTIDSKSYTFYKFTYFINQDMNLKITIS